MSGMTAAVRLLAKDFPGIRFDIGIHDISDAYVLRAHARDRHAVTDIDGRTVLMMQHEKAWLLNMLREEMRYLAALVRDPAVRFRIGQKSHSKRLVRS